MDNCILWDNATVHEINTGLYPSIVSHSIIQGGYSPCTNCPGVRWLKRDR